MSKFNLYIIRALTNMHVGSGDNNYNIIDNEVQRDVITNYPVINSSSLKGSLKEYFKSQKDEFEDSKNFIEKLVNTPFGSDNSIGQYKFFSANLLSIPVRSNVKQFFRATCPKIIEEFLTLYEDFNEKCSFEEQLKKLIKIGAEANTPLILVNNKSEYNFNNTKIESMEGKVYKVQNIKKLEKLFGKDIVLFNNETFDEIISSLPVIARNELDNGESKNLWYEEIVPRESRFYFNILMNNDEDYMKKFNNILIKGVVHIGANATIGYGYTRLYNVNDLVGDKSEQK